MNEISSERIVYLDNAATSYPKPESVYDAVNDFIRANSGSPSRGIGEGSVVTNKLLTETRSKLACFLGISKPQRLIFTYSATDGLSTIIFGWLNDGDHVLVSPLEHNSVLRPLETLREWNKVTFDVLPSDSIGRVDPDSIKRFAKPNTRLLSINMVSNVIGTVQNYLEVVNAAAELGIPVLLDGAQAAGHMKLDLDSIGAAFFACPGHKSLLGIQGTGLMYIAEGYDVRPLRIGGTGYLSESIKHPTTLPQYYEAGTINVPGVASLNSGLDYIESYQIDKIHSYITDMSGRLINGLKEVKNVSLYGHPNTNKGHSGVISFNIGAHSCAVVLAGNYRIANRIGIHCAPLAHKLIGTLDKGGTVRLSIGVFNTADDIDYVLKAVRKIACELG